MRRSMRGMGEDVHATFNSQIGQFKNLLIGLYRQKSKLSAEREALRFQYLSGMKSKISAAQSAIYQQLFVENNADGAELVRSLIGLIQNNIPMVLMNGSTIQGWGQNIFNVGGRHSVGQLSPLVHIFSEPFNDPSHADQRPMYQIYQASWLNDAQGPNWAIDYYFLPSWNRAYDAEGKAHELTIPMTAEFAAAWIKSRGKGYLSYAAPYAVAMLAHNFGSGSLNDILIQAKAMLKKILELTVTLVRLQLEIDATEADLAMFVADFSAYSGEAISLQEVIDSFKEEAQAPTVNPNDVPVGATVVEDAVVPDIPASQDESVVGPDVPVVVPEKSSLKLPAMLAAAGAIFMLTRKG